MVRFLNGGRVVVPQAGAGPATPGDYEATDQALVFGTAAQLSQQSGLYPSKLLGNAGFAKVDMNVTPRNLLSVRISTSRYSGENNVFIDPASPVTTYGISDNGIEHVETETAMASLTSTLSWRMVSHFRAQFSRDLHGRKATPVCHLHEFPGFSTVLAGPQFCRVRRVSTAATLLKPLAAKVNAPPGNLVVMRC